MTAAADATLTVAGSLTRRASLLLPFALAACGGQAPPRSYPPLRYDYLPPIPLNVATIEIEQRFLPLGMPPDVTPSDPAPPIDALRAMAQDRLKALGATGKAVFAITDASLTRRNDVINGHMAVVLTIYGPDGKRLGFAQAQVSRQHAGDIDDLPATLYDMTKSMMDAMNVEFEYQMRRNLRAWLVSATAVPTPVQQQPLESPSSQPPAAPPPPGALTAPTPLQPQPLTMPPSPYAPSPYPPMR